MLRHIKHLLPIGYLNYYRYLKELVNTNHFSGNLPAIFSKIYLSNHWKGNESICGFTSGVAETTEMRAALQQLWNELNISSLLDIPCGDFIWMKEMDLTGIKYMGGDIVEKMVLENNHRYGSDLIHFEIMDLTASKLPKVDLVICRDCLVHLSFQNVQKAIANIKASGSTWLLCTSFTKNKFNYNIQDGNWRTLNMQRPPFLFPKPIKTIQEYCPLGEGVFSDKALCLWKLTDI